jgi:hypothetical protein
MTPYYQHAAERMQEVKELIAFYESHGANWLLAAEYTLGLRSGALDQREHWLRDYIMIPRRRATRVSGKVSR